MSEIGSRNIFSIRKPGCARELVPCSIAIAIPLAICYLILWTPNVTNTINGFINNWLASHIK